MGRKALKRKLGKKVLAGKLTVGEARARLGREVAQRAQKSARPAWLAQPQPAPQLRYQGDDEFIRTAFRPLPRPPVTKSQKTPAGPSPQQMLTKARADAQAFDMCNRLPPVVVKQLDSTERAMVAELRRELALAGYDPTRREQIKSELARITGLLSGVV